MQSGPALQVSAGARRHLACFLGASSRSAGEEIASFTPKARKKAQNEIQNNPTAETPSVFLFFSFSSFLKQYSADPHFSQ